MKKLFILSYLLCLSISTVLMPAAAPAAPIPDLGYIFHNGTTDRPHAHRNAQSMKAVTAKNLPADIVITASTDDPSKPNTQESRMVLIQDGPPGVWNVDYTIIQPKTIAFSSQLKAQEFALDFLRESSIARKQKEAKDDALAKIAKRNRLAQSRSRMR